MTETPRGIQHELKQSRPFASPVEEAMVALMRTADVVRRYVAAVTEAEGVTLQQYNVLRILRGAGEAGLPTLEIAHRMIEQTPGTTRMIDRLSAKGWVTRERCPTDRRIVFCRITPQGRAVVDRLDEPLARATPGGLPGLSTKDVRTLIDTLDTVRAGHAARLANG